MQIRPDRIALGVSLIVTAVFMMSIQEALLKGFSDHASLWQIFTVRGLLVLPLLIVSALFLKQLKSIWCESFGIWPWLRAVSMTLMFVLVYAALPFLSLSTIAAGVYTSPIFVVVLSALVVKEPVGLRGWVAVLMGFVGVVVILQPGSDAFTFWAVLPVLGGFLYAVSSVITRTKCGESSPWALTLALNLSLLLAGIIFSGAVLFFQPKNDLTVLFPFVFGGWISLDIWGFGMMGLFALFAVAIGVVLARAYQSARGSIIATFDYCYLIFVVLWDYLFFSTALDGKTALGITLIIIAGLLVVGGGRPRLMKVRAGRV